MLINTFNIRYYLRMICSKPPIPTKRHIRNDVHVDPKQNMVAHRVLAERLRFDVNVRHKCHKVFVINVNRRIARGRCTRCAKSYVVDDGKPDEYYSITGVISRMRIPTLRDCIFPDDFLFGTRIVRCIYQTTITTTVPLPVQLIRTERENQFNHILSFVMLLQDPKTLLILKQNLSTVYGEDYVQIPKKCDTNDTVFLVVQSVRRSMFYVKNSSAVANDTRRNWRLKTEHDLNPHEFYLIFRVEGWRELHKEKSWSPRELKSAVVLHIYMTKSLLQHNLLM